MVLIDAAEAPEQEPVTRAPVTSSLKPEVLEVLTGEPRARADIARAVGRDPKDRSVGRVLGDLADEGQAERTGTEARPLWKVAGGKPLRADATCHLRRILDDPLGIDPADALPTGTCGCDPPGSARTDPAGRLRCGGCGRCSAPDGAA